jgi:hypothetical protein
MTIHHLHHGVTPCGMQGVPAVWPEGNKWTTEWRDVNCPACLKTKPLNVPNGRNRGRK